MCAVTSAMKKSLLSLFTIAALNVNATEKTISLGGSLQFFNQDLTDEWSLPNSLSGKQIIHAEFKIDNEDGLSLKKVYTDEFLFPPSQNNPDLLRAKLEVYYFNRPEGEYFSQQIFIYRNLNLIAKCTSYFPLDQGYLVPGVCSGRDGDKLLGTALYK